MKYKRFISADRRFQVELNKQVMSQILKQVKMAGRYETGGILIGHYDERHVCAVVASATKAPMDSKRGFTWFNRGIEGLQRLLNLHWNKKHYYLGEWHLHPYSNAIASGTDIRQMLSISNDPKYQCPEPILLIIGGSVEHFELKIYIAVEGRDFTELFPLGNTDIPALPGVNHQ